MVPFTFPVSEGVWTMASGMKVRLSSGDDVHLDSLMGERQFKSGKTGYGYYGKVQRVDEDGDVHHYQVILNVVEYQPGSNGKAKASTKKKNGSKRSKRRKATADE